MPIRGVLFDGDGCVLEVDGMVLPLFGGTSVGGYFHGRVISLVFMFLRHNKIFLFIIIDESDHFCLKFFIIEAITFSLFSFKFFLFCSFSFYLRFLSIAPNNILLSYFSSNSETLGFGSSFAQRIVNISLSSSAWFVMHYFANSAIHLCLYFINAYPL